MSDLIKFAKMDRGHVLCPGLFRSLSPADKLLPLRLRYQHTDTTAIEIVGPWRLGALDMRVLQAIVGLAGPEGLVLTDDPTTKAGRHLHTELYEPDHLMQYLRNRPVSLVIQSSLRRLADAIGAAGSGQDLKRIRESIERMFAISIFIEADGTRTGSRLLSTYRSQDGTGDIHVAVNPRLASAILGDIQYARIDLDDARQLETDPARLIHQRLCGWIDHGQTKAVSLQMLASYVWPDEAKTAARQRGRVHQVKKCIPEFAQIGWKLILVKDQVTITRPVLVI